MILSVCWTCETFTGLPSAHLNHGICRASHQSCWNLVLQPHGNTNDLVDVLYQWASTSPARLNRVRLPFSTGTSTTSFSYCTALDHPNLDLLDVGHCLCTTVCRTSPRHELRLRYLVSFRDFPGCSAPASGAVGCTAGVSTTPTNCQNLKP